MTMTWQTAEQTEQHNAAWEQAKREAVCNCVRFYNASEHHKKCPCHWSNIAQRAEEIRKEEK